MKWIRLSGLGSLLLSVTFLIVYLIQSAKRPSPILWLPIALFLSIGVTNLIWPWWQSRKKVDSVDTFFAKVWPQTRAIQATIYLIALAVGLFLYGLVFWHWGSNSAWGTTFFIILVSASITLGLYHLRRILRFDNAHYTALRQMLSQNLSEVMWVYEMPPIVPDQSDAHVIDEMSTLYFWLADNSVHRVNVPDSVVRPLFTFIQDMAPHVSIGYNPDPSDILHHPKNESASHE